MGKVMLKCLVVICGWFTGLMWNPVARTGLNKVTERQCENFCLTCGSDVGGPSFIQSSAGQNPPVQLQRLWQKSSTPLTSISWISTRPIPRYLQPRVGAAPRAPATAVTRLPAPAGPPLGLSSSGSQQFYGGDPRDLLLLILRDGVVPDLAFIVCVVFFSWVHVPKLCTHLGDVSLSWEKKAFTKEEMEVTLLPPEGVNKVTISLSIYLKWGKPMSLCIFS